MPRKQRFKPSRKPKPMPVAQAQDGAQIERMNAQPDEGSRASEANRPETAADGGTPRREEAEAR